MTPSPSSSVDVSANHGFSLIEVLISMLIFAVGALGALALTNFIFSNYRDSRNLTEGTTAGRSEMERILGQSGGALAECAPSTCANGLGCSLTNCWRQVRVQPGGVPFQVDNFRRRNGAVINIEVRVRYPRNRDAQGLGRSAAGTADPGWVDCLATPDQCKTLFFHGQKPAN